MGRGRQQGFTLIEMMIVVAIVGLLAALAIPQYSAFLLRSKRAEVPMQVDAIRTVEFAYSAEWDQFTSCAARPNDVPGRVAANFGVGLLDDTDWNLLGWVPDGKVYGQYEVTAESPSEDVILFTAVGLADIDGDGTLAEFIADQSQKPSMTTPNTVY